MKFRSQSVWLFRIAMVQHAKEVVKADGTLAAGTSDEVHLLTLLRLLTHSSSTPLSPFDPHSVAVVPIST